MRYALWLLALFAFSAVASDPEAEKAERAARGMLAGTSWLPITDEFFIRAVHEGQRSSLKPDQRLFWILVKGESKQEPALATVDCTQWTFWLGSPLTASNILPDTALEYVADIACGNAARIPDDSPYERQFPDPKTKELARTFIRMVVTGK